ncbi:MAG: DNA primase [Candidatus Adiutrix sp.]|jgi:DNA primase|nr:DNA primase [Candidatus Adiutrix sp.]
MSYYPQDKIDEVNEAADLVELVSHYVSLKRAGAAYKGLCPFHSEKTPSFVVTPHRRMFHCFGCGVGGGPIRFLMMISGQSFPEAVEELARRYGVELPAPEKSDRPRENRENRAALHEALQKSADYYEKNLWGPEGGAARAYLGGRGLSQRQAREFKLGLSLPGWEGLRRCLAAQGFGDQVMLEAGLIKPGREKGHFYDLFRDRLMVPIVGPEGRVAGFGGRLLADQEGRPKYINSPETPVYKKERLLFGFHRARPFLRSAGLVFLVEGYFDLISLVAAGINEVVAPLGTALTARQLGLLRGQVREVMLLFDSDEAGQRAAARALPLLLNAELDGRVLVLPQGHDPDSFVREFGAEALFEAATQAMDIVDFQVAHLRRSHPDSPAGQARMAREARELVALVPDSVNSRLLRRRLARLLGLDEELLGAFRKERAGERRLTHERRPGARPAQSCDQQAGQLLRHILIYPETAGPVLGEMAAWWPDDASRPLFERLKKVYEERGRIEPQDALDDESDEIAALVSGAALSERENSPEEAAAVAGEYMGRLRQNRVRQRRGELTAAVRRAEARGDQAEALRLLKEKISLPQ